MNIYFVNKDNGAKVEVMTKANKEGTLYWVSKLSQAPIIKVSEDIPEHIEVVYDCKEERDRIGKQLFAIRTSKGLTAKELQTLCGVQYNKIFNTEKGKVNPTIDSITRIATALGYKLTLVPIDF